MDSKSKIATITDDEIAKLKKKVVLKALELEFRDQFYSDPDSMLDGKYKEAWDILHEIKKDNKEGMHCQYALVTVNPKEESDEDPDWLRSFVAKVEKAVTKKWIKWYMYCFEQRGTSEGCDLGRGVHAHILVHYDRKRKSQIEREFRSTFKKFIGNDQHVNVKLTTDKLYKNFISYIKGESKSKVGSKKAKHVSDELWRQMFALQNLYTNCNESTAAPGSSEASNPV